MYEAVVAVPTTLDALFECIRNGVPGPVIAHECDGDCGLPHIQVWCELADEPDAMRAFERWAESRTTLIEVVELPTS